MENPKISVIITAYNRKDYLLYAINSVLNQTLSRDKYEIIVIKNFDDNVTDDFIESNHVKKIRMDGTIGEFLYSGINESKGNIISFLDDDDYFDKSKLEMVLNAFENNPDIIYYHNSQVFVNEKNEFIKENDSLLSGRINFYDAIQNWLNIGNLFFNLSSICIKREAYLKYLKPLKELKIHQDDFMFFFALDGSANIFNDPSHLTYCRLHKSTSNIKIEIFREEDISYYRSQKISLWSLYSEATDHIIKNLENKTLKEMMEFRLIQEKIDLNFYRKDKFEKENFSLFIQLIRFIIKHRKCLSIHDSQFLFLLFYSTYKSIFHFQMPFPFKNLSIRLFR